MRSILTDRRSQILCWYRHRRDGRCWSSLSVRDLTSTDSRVVYLRLHRSGISRNSHRVLCELRGRIAPFRRYFSMGEFKGLGDASPSHTNTLADGSHFRPPHVRRHHPFCQHLRLGKPSPSHAKRERARGNQCHGETARHGANRTLRY